jgi:hypothetical protein
MNLDFYESESMAEPDEVDAVSSPTTVYIRRNIRQETLTDIDGSETVWKFDEAKVSRQEFEAYRAEKQEADIAYLFMMGGFEYNG